METQHDCGDHGPSMNDGLVIALKWFGWCIEFKGNEIRIEFCPFCGINLEKQR